MPTATLTSPGKKLLRDRARAEIDAVTEVLRQLQVVESSIVPPPLKTVLEAAEWWG